MIFTLFSNYHGFKNDILRTDNYRCKREVLNLRQIKSHSKNKNVNYELPKTFLIENTGIGNKNKNKNRAKLIVDNLSFKNYLNSIGTQSDQQPNKKSKKIY